MHFTGAFATVLILRIGLPDSAKPYGYMRLFLRPTVPRVCATAVCPGVRSSQNAPSLDPLSYPSDHYLRLRSIRRAVPFSVTLRLHCIFRRLPCACAYTPAWSPEARARTEDAITRFRQAKDCSSTDWNKRCHVNAPFLRSSCDKLLDSKLIGELHS